MSNTKENSKADVRSYLLREALLLFLFTYVILIGGGFGATVDFRRQLFSATLGAIVLGSWLLVRLLRREHIHGSGIDVAILAFVGAQFVAVLFSEDIRRSLPHAGLWLFYLLAFLFSLDTLSRGWRSELFVKCLLISGTVLLVFSSTDLGRLLWEWRSLITGLQYVPGFEHRLDTILGDPNLLAAFTNLLVPLAVASFLLSSRKSARVALVLYVVLSLVTLVFTDSRGGLLGFVGSVAALSFLWVMVVSEQAMAQVRSGAAWFWRRKVLLFSGIVLLASLAGFAIWRLLSFQGSTTHAPVAEARDIFWQAATNALRADPLTGAGPGMYPIYLMKIWSTPPARPYLHAHSLPFQIAAESGLLGLITGTFLVFFVVWQARGGWSELSANERGIRAAAVAALIGLSTHSLVDHFFPFPAVGFTSIVLLAIIVKPAAVTTTLKYRSPWIIALLGLTLTVFSFNNLRAFSFAERSLVLSTQGDWSAAAEEMSTAANHDPAFGFYWLQAGYAYGRATESDQHFIDMAISSYERGIRLEPKYAINHANLGALFWADGQLDLALGEMHTATQLAQDSWLLWLNRGAIEEMLGLTMSATGSYREAIRLRPEILGAAFWDLTELRAAAANVDPEASAETETRSGVAAIAEEARRLVAEAEFESAEPLFEEAYRLNDQEVRLYLGLAERAAALGKLDTAEQYARLALWLPATSNQAKAEVILLAAEISLANGDEMEAFRRYQIAYDAIFADTAYGWASAGWSPYAWFVWQRPSFSEDLLPQLQRADITVEMASRLVPLAEMYDEQDDPRSAARIRAQLLPYLQLD